MLVGVDYPLFIAQVEDTKVGVLAEYYSIEEGTAHTDKLLCIVALNYF